MRWLVYVQVVAGLAVAVAVDPVAALGGVGLCVLGLAGAWIWVWIGRPHRTVAPVWRGRSGEVIGSDIPRGTPRVLVTERDIITGSYQPDRHTGA